MRNRRCLWCGGIHEIECQIGRRLLRLKAKIEAGEYDSDFPDRNTKLIFARYLFLEGRITDDPEGVFFR